MKKFNKKEITSGLKTITDWSYIEGAIEKKFVFKNFKETLANMIKIGFEAEAMNHHPEWFNVYNKLTVRLNTHDVGGITKKDFDLAKKIDEVLIK